MMLVVRRKKLSPQVIPASSWSSRRDGASMISSRTQSALPSEAGKRESWVRLDNYLPMHVWRASPRSRDEPSLFVGLLRSVYVNTSRNSLLYCSRPMRNGIYGMDSHPQLPYPHQRGGRHSRSSLSDKSLTWPAKQMGTSGASSKERQGRT